MTEPRTITVPTVDHGDVTVPEPFWCTGHHPPGGYRADLAHEGEELALVVETPCHGPLRALSAALYQAPFSSTQTGVVVAVEFGEPFTTESHDYNSQDLAALADALVSFGVGELHQLIERLQLLEGDK
ncbi:DUF6907 domain-containing protein [Streptomyces sp. NPDC001705]